MLSRILDPALWDVQMAANNRSALKLARAVGYDLLLSGAKTSGREDVELLRRIRRLHPKTRVIILTGETTRVEVLEAIRAGAFSYFSRPVSYSALESMIRSAVDSPAWDDGIEIVSATRQWLRLRVRCDLRTAERLLQFLNEMVNLPEQDKQGIAVACRELLMN